MNITIEFELYFDARLRSKAAIRAGYSETKAAVKKLAIVVAIASMSALARPAASTRAAEVGRQQPAYPERIHGALQSVACAFAADEWS
jgi:hypothetical protein